MNEYAVIILAGIVLIEAVEWYADRLNLSALKREVPDEFSDVYDAEEYAKSQEYTKEKTKFGWLGGGFDLAAFLLFWFLGGFVWLDAVVEGWGMSQLFTGIAYIGLLGGAKAVLDLPFTLYSTFVIEEKYGFNTTTAKTFLLDTLKSLALTLIIGGPIIAVILFFFMEAGPLAWLIAWGSVSIVTIALQYIAPHWIMPLFNKFEPLEEGELRSAILAYADSVDFPLDGIYVMDASKRSRKSNAFFTGFGKSKRIVLFDTLVASHAVTEIVSVIAHEVGHYKKKHIPLNMALSVGYTGVMFYLLSLFIGSDALARAFYVQEASVYTGIVFFGVLFSPLSTMLSAAMNVLSRRHEYQADTFASDTYEKPMELAEALKKLSKENLSNLTPHPFYVRLHYSHPPVLARIEALKRL